MASSEHKQKKGERHLKVTAHALKAIQRYNLAEYILMQQIEDEEGKWGPYTPEGGGCGFRPLPSARPTPFAVRQFLHLLLVAALHSIEM